MEEKQKARIAVKGRKGSIIKLTLLVTVTIVIVAGVLIYCLMPEKGRGNSEGGFGTGFDSSFAEKFTQGNIVSAYGVTGIGTIQAEFPITDLENNLEIEEVYIASGDLLEEGTPILKFTSESVEAVKKELEEDLRAADLAYRAGVIEYEQSKITALYEKEKTILEGEQAEAVYNESISGLSDQVESAKENLDEVKAQIAEYEAAIAAGNYYEQYQVEYYKNLYDENLSILKEKIDKWQVSWSEVTSGRVSGNSGGSMGNTGGMPGGSMGGSGGMPTVQSTGSGMDLHSQYVLVLSSLYNVLEQNLQDYEDALEAAENAAADNEFELQSLKLQLSSLEQTYAQAKQSYETSISQAELTKQTSLSNADKAENNYQADMEKAEADYEALKGVREEAEENLALFDELIKDNYLYASESGTILRANFRSGSSIGSESRLYTLRDTSEMTVTVSVDQSSIASVNVGDAAVVQSEENGIYNGIVKSVNPISASGSKTNITYSVTVQLSGAFEDLSANETVVVYFGMEGQMR